MNIQKLCIPAGVLKQHLVVLGKTGAGKSSALRHVVEHLLEAGKRVCILDPKGDWSGLKSSADGKSGGFEIIGFGDFKEPKAQDIPINAHSGKHVAELIASGNRPCIIGFRGWTVGDRTRFWIDFAQALYACKTLGELYLVGDEFHNFAPKGKILSPEAGMCLHWSNTLLGEGRGLGLICLLATQRPQKLHNDVLTQCETLVAMKVIHSADRQAVKDWIDGCGDSTMGKVVLDSLAGLPRGTGYVWSPEIGFGPTKIAFPMFTTFDSFAPPQLQKKVSESGWADVNLTEVREKLAVVIKEATANDPRELRRQIKELEHNLNCKVREMARLAADKPETNTKEVSVLQEKDRTALSTLIESIEGVHVKMDDIQKVTSTIRPQLEAFRQLLSHPLISVSSTFRKPSISEARPLREAASDDGVVYYLPKSERKILGVLANFPHGKSKRDVALLAGYAVGGGGFNNSISALRTKGFISSGDPLVATPSGLVANGPVEPLPSGRELFDYWMRHPELGKAEREILRVLYEANGNCLSKENIARHTKSNTGEPYEAGGGGFNNAISKLRAMEIIEGKGELRAREVFYP